MRFIRTFLILAVMALLAHPLAGCSDDSDDAQVDATGDADTSGGEDAGADSSGDEDTQGDEDATDEDTAGDDTADDDAAGDDAGDASGPGLPETCEDDCRETVLTLEYDGMTEPLSHAAFGLTAPAITDSGEWEVYIEAWEGGFEGCPVQNSPSPDWQFIITGFGLPQDATPLTKVDDGIFLTLLDYDGKLLGLEPSAKATSATFTPVAMRIDTDLVAQGTQDEQGFIALDIEGVFAQDGQTSGHVYAKHCASMDLLNE